MQKDFHYYATYSAAFLAGYSHEESVTIATSAQFVDDCTVALLKSIEGPEEAATTQLQMELANYYTDTLGIQNITRIWASFHFLPYDLYADVKKGTRAYKNKFRLICGPNGKLLADTIETARGKDLQAIGIAMHVLADTWAHSYFAGTPSLVINNTNRFVTELLEKDGEETERPIVFKHRLGVADDPEEGDYTASIYQSSEKSIMNLGHGRIGHLPDYSYIKYRYMPAWGDYGEVIKDNPNEYYKAFSQMVYAMKYLRGVNSEFKLDTYDTDSVEKLKPELFRILRKRQIDACEDWKAFGEKLSGQVIPEYSTKSYENEYKGADRNSKMNTFIGKFILAAMAQKSMVTNKIYKSGNLIAGYSINVDRSVIKEMDNLRYFLEYFRR